MAESGKGNAADGTPDVEIHTYRRSNVAKNYTEGHDYAKLDGRHADSNHHWQKNRRHNHDQGNSFHKGTEDNNQGTHKKYKQIFVGCNA